MTVFFPFIFCALYFYYLKNWAESYLSSEYNFGSPLPPEPIPHSTLLSILVGILWGIILLAGVFWGFTFNRYPEHLSVRGTDIEVIFLVILFVTILLSYFVMYRLGEIKGVEQMKNTQLFRDAMGMNK